MVLSIIIPYFNSNAWIGKMLDSLLDQDLEPSDYEIIVVDDGSTEEPVVLKDYAERYPQIHYHRRDNAGVSAARNYGLSLALGDWLYICDSDDYLQPGVLGGIIAAAEERGLEMISANRLEVYPSDQVSAPRRNFSDVSGTMTGLEYLDYPSFSWGVWSFLLRRSVVEEHKMAFEHIFYVEDRLFMLDLLPIISSVAHIDVDLYYYVQHDISVLHSRRKQNGPEFIEAWFKYLKKLNELIKDVSVPAYVSNSSQVRLAADSFVLLLNAFQYCPVEDTINSISRLEAIGAYPIGKSNHRQAQLLRPVVNCKHLWIFLCKCYHIIKNGKVS